MKKRIVKVEVEICYDPKDDPPIIFDNDEDIAKQFASCVIGDDFSYVAIYYEGKEI